MFIKSLSLHNIRSYERETITFEKGTTLLSGDIGSGKTTILIALEYALFGLLRGKTQPSELLRHSAKEGSITLDVTIAGKSVQITRGLKRGKSSISQTSGTLVIDGVQEELVATEIKAKILTLLGYPESLISKSTNLFRYTVYTPQEQVKLILYEKVEERKDIIRNIFGVDKYKRVAQNIQPYVGTLREEIAHAKGQVTDVNIVEQQLTAAKKELLQIQEKIKPLELSLKKAQEQTLEKKKDLLEQKKLQEEQRKLIQAQALAKQQLENEKKMILLLVNQQEQLEKKLKESSLKKIEYTPEKKKTIQEALDKLAEKKSLLNKKYGELAAKKDQAHQAQKDIQGLTLCPVCKQEVGDDHKDHIVEIQNKQLLEVKTKQQDYDVLALKIKDNEEKLKNKLKEEQEKETAYKLYEQQQKQLLEQQKELAVLVKTIEEKKSQLKLKEQQQQPLPTKELITLEPLEKAYETHLKQEQQLALTLRELSTQESRSQRDIKQLNEALTLKKKIATRIQDLTTTRTWVQELFVPLVKTIEKRVLLSIYQEFNAYFSDWFSMLIDDDNLTVRLDEEFTPLISQHGYDTQISNLSGGEQTSVALAYRLALNKVLNDYFSTLQTTGLLILDEPTNGFSSQQLDKLRDVLTQIGVEQVLIVSHEQKLESVADHIITVTKHHATTKIAYSS